jgi:hypothetical protein
MSSEKSQWIIILNHLPLSLGTRDGASTGVNSGSETMMENFKYDLSEAIDDKGEPVIDLETGKKKMKILRPNGEPAYGPTGEKGGILTVLEGDDVVVLQLAGKLDLYDAKGELLPVPPPSVSSLSGNRLYEFRSLYPRSEFQALYSDKMIWNEWAAIK